LSCLIRKEIENTALHELHICRWALGISHPLFVDENLLFLMDQSPKLKFSNQSLVHMSKAHGSWWA
jgi:hypothetical protein